MSSTSNTWPNAPYPPARRSDFSKEYASKEHGKVAVNDPYEWLEHDSDETKAFVKSQADYTEAYISQSQELRDKLKAEITANFNYPRFGCPSLRGDYYYYSYNTGLQSQTPMYRIPKNDMDTASLGELFFDPNLLSKDGTTALSSTSFSKDGQYFAYGVSKSGSDWVEAFVRKTSSPHKADATPGTDEGRLADHIKWIKFSGLSWTPDNKGFFYGRFPPPSGDKDAGTETDANLNQKLYYHRLGTNQEEDILVMEDKEDDASQLCFGGRVSEDGRWLYVSTSKDTGRSNLLQVADLSIEQVGPSMEFHPVVTEWGSEFSVIGNDGPLLYIQTNKDAPRDRVVKYNLEHPEQGFVDLIPEDANGAVLNSASIHGNDKLLLIYKVDVVDRLYLHDLKTGIRLCQIGSDMLATVGSLTGKREQNELFFSISSFLSPGQIFRYQFDKPAGQELSLYRSTRVTGIDANDYTAEQVFYPSKDGTKIPMFIVTPKGVKRDGSAPCLLYGYGGFAVNIEPTFSASWMSFLKSFNAVLAVPNIRGGSEYGEDWHQAGCFDKKQNVFDDFQAAARYILDSKIAGKVVASGGSNGGLLVAACVEQAPELFAAGVAEVGVLDMLRFASFTIGAHWRADYGDPATPEGFDYLYKYSPVHNVRPDKPLPALLLMTGDHDDRVSPLHSFKMAAEMQHTLPHNPQPLLLRVDIESGHGAGKSTEKRIQEAADKWTFVAKALNLKWQGA